MLFPLEQLLIFRTSEPDVSMLWAPLRPIELVPLAFFVCDVILNRPRTARQSPSGIAAFLTWFGRGIGERTIRGRKFPMLVARISVPAPQFLRNAPIVGIAFDANVAEWVRLACVDPVGRLIDVADVIHATIRVRDQDDVRVFFFQLMQAPANKFTFHSMPVGFELPGFLVDLLNL